MYFKLPQISEGSYKDTGEQDPGVTEQSKPREERRGLMETGRAGPSSF